jgi:hypothetical protein
MKSLIMEFDHLAEKTFHAVARLSSNILDLPDGGSASLAADADSHTLIGS